jgi:hypothetical protein
VQYALFHHLLKGDASVVVASHRFKSVRACQISHAGAHQRWSCDPGPSAEDEPLCAASEGRHRFDIYTAKGGTRQVTKSTGIGSTETGLKPLWQQLIYYGPGRLA